MIRNFILIVLAIVFFACDKKKSGSNYANPKIIGAKDYRVPLDSLKEPKVVTVNKSKLKKVLVGKPKSILTNTNTQLMGNPKIIMVGSPQICIPGQDGFQLAKTFPVVNNRITSSTQVIKFDKEPYTKDYNSKSMGGFGMIPVLSDILIYSIAEDKFGNIWCGTLDGLARYDGKNVTYFTDNEAPFGPIHNIAFDKSGNLWFSTIYGVTKFDGKFFTHFTEKEGLSSNSVHAILEDKSGVLWFGTSNGITKFDGKSFTHFSTNQGLAGNDVSAILEDKIGNLWFGTHAGISKYNGVSFTNFTQKEGLPYNHIWPICEDKSGSLWFGTIGGVIKYDRNTFTHFTKNEGLLDNYVKSIIEDKYGDLWFWTRGGISKYDGNYFTHFTNKELALDNNRYSILEDKSGNLWFGGFGLTKFVGNSARHFTTQEGFSNISILSIMEDKNGNLWFGTKGGGIIKYDKFSFFNFTDKDGLSDNTVLSLIEDNSGNIWFGSLNGVMKYDGKSITSFTKKEGLSGNHVSAILKDRAGNLWFGTLDGGITKYDGISFTHFTVREGLSNNVVMSIHEDRPGNLWFGTERGVSKFDGKNFTHFIDKDGLPNNIVMAISEDITGNLWFGTNGGGVSRYDGNSFITLTDKQGLTDNFVNSITVDTSGNLWVGTNSGLSLLPHDRLADILNLENAKSKSTAGIGVIFKSYDFHDGFLNVGVNSGKTIFEEKDGTLWIAAKDRLSSFRKEGLITKNPAPNAQLTNIFLFNESIPWQNVEHKKDTSIVLSNGIVIGDFKFSGIKKWYSLPDELILAYDQNFISFQFIGITMDQPKKVRYQYKLEGLDKNWSTITNRTEATYGNLPDGNYTFAVKSMSSSGIWGEEFHYPFTIRPPWWKSVWAYSFYGLLFFTVMFSGIRYQNARVIEAERERTRAKELAQAKEIEKAYHELKSTQAQLIQTEKMASLGELTAGIAHEIQNPLNFVNNFSEVNKELADELEQQINNGNAEDVKALAKDIKENQEKILYHGKRADAIVKGMLEHSRTSSGKKEPTNINALCDEYLRLAYHGYRAKDKSFNAKFETHLDPTLPKINVVPQDMGRVILNLINNAFYAVNEKVKQTREGYKPLVTLTTRSSIGKVEVEVKDNGNGIPDPIKEKIFQPFFTTKPTGQGTGLGLSLAFDIVTKGHGGELKVYSKEGDGTEFKIILIV